MLEAANNYGRCPNCRSSVNISHYQSPDFQYFDENQDEIKTVIAEKLLSFMKLDSVNFNIVSMRLLNPNTSIRRISATLHISHNAVHKRLKKMMKIYPSLNNILKNNYGLASKNKVKI
jgi:hypothetical protein